MIIKIYYLFLYFIVIYSRQQWYLTGKNYNDNKITTKYIQEVINLWNIKNKTENEINNIIIQNITENNNNNSNTTNNDNNNTITTQNTTQNNTHIHTLYGGAIAVYLGYNQTIDKSIEILLYEILNHSKKIKIIQFDVINVWIYDIFVTINQNLPLEYEIGLYDHPS